MDNSELISRLAYVCYCSSYVRTLHIQEEGGTVKIRGQLHLFLRAKSDTFKSTMLKQIARHFKIRTKELITNAGLVGTIDKNEGVIPGECWRARNSLMLLDEFNIDGESNCVPSLLTLLEDQEYSKSIGRRTHEKREEDGDLFFEVKNGEIGVKTRFSCVICSMRKIEKSRSVNVEALLSRCVVLRYNLTPEEVKRVMNGFPLLSIKKCPFKKPFDRIIGKKAYKEIMNCVESYPNFDMDKHFPRIVGDCCRVFAVLGRHDKELYHEITRLAQEL